MRRGGGRFYPYEEIIRAGEYSDDTQLTMAVARCRLIAGSAWWDALTRTEIPLWTLYERGGGGATKRAADCWIRGTPPWQGRAKSNVRRYFEAGGNGVAMRVIPHALFFAGEADARGLIRDVVLDGVATHGHPRALVGASAYSFAAWWLLRTTQTGAIGKLVDVLLDEAKVWGTLPSEKDLKDGWLDAANNAFRGGYDKVWQETVSEMCLLLDRVRSGLQDGAIANYVAVLKGLGAFGSSKGSGTIGAAAALYLVARYAIRPTQAVLKAAFARDADTDTIAAMAGGLAGCLSGTDWLPREWFKVQDCDYLRDLAYKVSQGSVAAVERPPNLQVLGATQLKAVRTALAMSKEGEFEFDGVRKARILKSGEPVALSKSTKVHTWLLCVEGGQTLYITKVGRRVPDLKDSLKQVKQVSGRTVHGIKAMRRGKRFLRPPDLDTNLPEVVESAPARNAERDGTVTAATKGVKGGKTPRFGEDWTSTKLKVLAGYLLSYTNALKDKPTAEQPFKKWYIDAFAGGDYQEVHRKGSSEPSRQGHPSPDLAETELQGFLDASASLALKTEPRFDSYIFFERNAKRNKVLKGFKQEFPNLAKDISIRNGDPNKKIQDLCNKDWSSQRAVLFLDPYGMRVEWATIEAVAKTKAIDLWVLFPLGIPVKHLLTESGDIHKRCLKRLDPLFGTKDWCGEFYYKQTPADLFGKEQKRVVKAPMEAAGRYYNDRLKGIFAGVVDEPRVLRSSGNKPKPLYLLCFAVGNEKGKPIALSLARHLLKRVR